MQTSAKKVIVVMFYKCFTIDVFPDNTSYHNTLKKQPQHILIKNNMERK